MLEVEQAYEYASSLPGNNLTARQWEVLKGPDRIDVKRIYIVARRSLFKFKQIRLNVQRFYIDVKRIEIAADRKISHVTKKFSYVIRKISYVIGKISWAMRKISDVKVSDYDNYQKFFAAHRLVFDVYKSSMYFQV
jgi:hypothetical protein